MVGGRELKPLVDVSKYPDVDFAKLNWNLHTDARSTSVMLSPEYYAYLREGAFHSTFAVLGNRNRLRILELIANTELQLDEIAALLGITQANAWYHIKKLIDAGLIVRPSIYSFTIRSAAAVELRAYVNEVLVPDAEKDPALAVDPETARRNRWNWYSRGDGISAADDAANAAYIDALLGL